MMMLKNDANRRLSFKGKKQFIRDKRVAQTNLLVVGALTNSAFFLAFCAHKNHGPELFIELAS